MPCFYVYDSAMESYQKNVKPESRTSKVMKFFGGGDKEEDDSSKSNQV